PENYPPPQSPPASNTYQSPAHYKTHPPRPCATAHNPSAANSPPHPPTHRSCCPEYIAPTPDRCNSSAKTSSHYPPDSPIDNPQTSHPSAAPPLSKTPASSP